MSAATWYTAVTDITNKDLRKALRIETESLFMIAKATVRPVAVPRWGRGTQAPNLAVLLAHCGQLILRKIITFDASRCQILRLKCIKFGFRWADSAPQIP